MARVDHSGKVFGYITVVSPLGTKDKHGRHEWLCRCICGKELVKVPSTFRGALSCGCYVRNIKPKSAKTIVDGKKSREYGRYMSMIRRCYRESCSDYKNYGGRGITVCDEWRNNYDCFYSWLTSFSNYKNLTIERLDVNGPYSPDNCTMVDNKLQPKNRTITARIEYRGVVYTVREIIDMFKLNMHPDHLARRVKMGWDVEKAIFTPVRVCKDHNPERHRYRSYNEDIYIKSKSAAPTNIRQYECYIQ